MKKCGTRREENYDLLRVVSLLGVICLHVGAMYSGKLPEQTRYAFRISADILHFATRFAVPCFVMLSGAFLLSDKRNKEYGYFYRKSFRKLGIPLLVCSCFSFFYRESEILWQNGICHEMWIPLKEWMQGSPYYHLWYMYMLTGLYLLTPVILRFKESVTERGFVGATIGCMLAAVATALTSSGYLNWDLRKVACYLGYFMLGKVLYDHFQKREKRYGFWYLLCGGLFLILTVCLKEADLGGHAFLGIRINYLNDFAPCNVLAAVCLFSAAANITVHGKRIGKVAACSYYLYLVHALVLDVTEKAASLWPQRFQILPLWLLAECGIVFFISMGIALLIQRIGRQRENELEQRTKNE